ncbi:2-oxoglutarate and iron-dependent oxygenase domain-containing protein ICU11 [Hirschfeldia incana]|nr:2-oxoglutarate and iron-dependent oxygenase domain-containing protein ICU11 [Hirschfeldia incana]
MALGSSSKQPDPPHQQQPRASQETLNARLKLRRTPNEEHEPEHYEDLQLGFNPSLFRSLERFLPENLLGSTRIEKARAMSDLLLRYSPQSERIRVQKHREYRQNILSSYQRLNEELYTLDPASFFVPSFLDAVNNTSEESFKSVIVRAAPGIYTFDVFKPQFCQMLIAEVENMEKWFHYSKSSMMRPTTINKFGVVLDDFGLDGMLQKLLEDFISPISQVLFPEVCGTSLDSHHGYAIEYGKYRDTDLGFHVDDSEVTLNVCLGNQFSGGELYFRGVRCDNHVNSEIKENYDYSQVPGRAVLHHGRHRHGARAITCGRLVNLVMWCRSSTFREAKRYQKDFSIWCGGCKLEKHNRQQAAIKATAEVLKRRGREKAHVEIGSKSTAH